MKTAKLEEELLIEKYILRQMTEEEATEFEAFYLSNQECLDQLEFAQRLSQGFKQIEAAPEGTLAGFYTVKETERKSWWRRGVPAWSLAASLLLAILPSTVLYQMLQPNNADSAISVVNFTMPELRGKELQGDEQGVVINSNGRQVILSTYIDSDLESMDFPAYSFK